MIGQICPHEIKAMNYRGHAGVAREKGQRLTALTSRQRLAERSVKPHDGRGQEKEAVGQVEAQ
jgi:hypothetical protein